jgi:pimeloyl-ACP methyl ester carboxylesterase
VAVFAAAAAVMLSITTTPTAAVSRRQGGSLDWQPCADAPTVDCATLRVPIDWANPRGANIDLALARRKATDPDRRIGSLLVNTGGPGGSGVDDVKAGSNVFSADLMARFDLVEWDPRGVGLSHQVKCNANLLDNPVSLFPDNQSEFAALGAYNRRLMDSCRADTGPLFDHLDTASNARDLDAIRAALGENKATFYGLSYGTLIGEQYAELFPSHIRAIALDSNEDHSIGALRYVTTLSKALEDSYGQFADWCIRTPTCVLYPRDPRNVLDTLYARAQRGTLYVPGSPDQTITPEDLLGALRGSLVGIADWPPLAQNILAALDEPVLAPAAHPAPASAEPSTEITQRAIICEDHVWDVSSIADLQVLRQAMSRVAPHTHMSTTGFKDVTGCLGFPRPIANPQHDLVVHDAPPIFMVNSRYDVATPYPGAINAAQQMGPSTVLLTYDGTSHADYEETSCVQEAFDAYLISLTTPGPRAHCPAVFPTSLRPAGKS